MVNTKRILVLLFCAAALALAPAVSAAPVTGGPVLIDQSASAKGLPGCPSAGFPIIICQPGSYQLTGNLTIAGVNTDGIVINADNVTLDLGGFTISGPVTCTPSFQQVQCTGSGTGVGIRAGVGTPTPVHNNITIRNGTVRGMGDSGIALQGSGVLIDGVHVESNGGGSSTASGIFLTGVGGVVLHCTSYANGGRGIYAGNETTTILSNSVSSNRSSGIVGGGVASHNSVIGNLGSGIDSTSLASYNNVRGNGGYGIFANAYIGNVILSNGLGDVGPASTSLGHNLCSNNVVC